LANDCLRLMMEPRDRDLDDALSNVAEMEAVLDVAEVDRPRLLHGFRATAWPLIEEAARRGYATRAGLEDTFELADGRTARDNAEIVAEAAIRIATITGRG
ncbi:MAG TPA: 3-keto-5-aminohexanoate cleavage protein, partial [Gemmatimonadetes bacterium]|nr:3-keto-5-aminohexanoate cleavage protein [Gemmatimonadota bacterium]